MIFFRRKKKMAGRLDIAITGLCPGCGATHLAISLATYLVHAKRLKVGIMSRETDYDCLLDNSCRLKPWGFVKNNICFVRYCENIDEDFDCMIVDFGEGFGGRKEEFFRCGKRIVVADLTAWKQQSLTGHIAKYGINKDNIYLYAFGDKKVAAVFFRRLHIKFRPIPREDNALVIDGANFGFYESLIKIE